MSTLAKLLGEVVGGGDFVTSSSLPAFSLAVTRVGPIELPVTKERFDALKAVARRAPYGLREETLVDPEVRDTWEVAKSRLKIGADSKRALRDVLPELQRALGLPEEGRLSAELYKLLLYEPGQHFATHQDSEKTGSMIGTLIVELPSRYQGGTLVVRHGARARRFERADADGIRLIAFYGDCHHEVEAVRSGHRVVLVYNLVFEGAPLPVQSSPAGLERAVAAHFETVPPPRWVRDERAAPDRLVYLLDHEYSEHSLGWDRLKGSDRARVSALLAIADRIECDACLALAEIHEVWDCEWRERRGRWIEPSEPKPQYIMVSEIDLEHAIDRSGAPIEGFGDHVESLELCFTRATHELDPLKSEYEPYMGNAGNSMEYWYRRAALVLWPRARAFAIRGRAALPWAMGEIGGVLARGEREEARRMAEQIAPYMRSRAREPTRAFFATTLRVAAELEAPELARALLLGFSLELLDAEHAAPLAALLAAYGLEWWKATFEGWGGSPSSTSFVSGLPELCFALGEGEAAAWLVERERAQLAKDLASWNELPPALQSANRRAELISRLAGLVRATRGSAARLALEKWLVSPEIDVTQLVALLRHLGELALEELGALRAIAVARLTEALARAPREAGDWRIAVDLGCTCELCATLGEFLSGPKQRLEWPLSKERRQHVHGKIDRRGLPVTHVTRRSGSPHTLVLTKTQELFEREASARKAWGADLEWLEAPPSSLKAPRGKRRGRPPARGRG